MTAWTAPKTWVTLENLTKADINTYIRDNTLHLKEQLATPPNYQIKEKTNAAATIASGTFADVHGDLNIGFFTPRSASSQIMIVFEATLSSSVTPSDNLSIDFSIDGTRMGDATYGSFLISVPNSSGRLPVHLTRFTTLSVASHAIKPMWRRDGGTTWTAAGTLGQGMRFWVYELGGISP